MCYYAIPEAGSDVYVLIHLQFMQELVRVAAPGGSIIYTTCCHRDLLTGETSLEPCEQVYEYDIVNCVRTKSTIVYLCSIDKSFKMLKGHLWGWTLEFSYNILGCS